MKFQKIINIEDFEILTDEGWKDFSGLGITPPLDIIEIETSNGLILKGAPNHSIFKSDLSEVDLLNIEINDIIFTKNGPESVIKKTILNKKEIMYDILDVSNSRYYTNDILSHNCGKSTSFEIFVCWNLLFNKDKTIALLANKAEQARDLLRKVKLAYELLPKWLQQGVYVWNSGSIKLENGNMVIASATSSTAIRGRSIWCAICDERSFVENSVWSGFISSVYPTISSGKDSKVIYVSTPNGMNHFYKDWTDAIEGRNKFHPIKVDWWQVPGRDEKWKEETIANIGMQRFLQEYQNSFLGSIATLIEPEIVRELKHKQEIEHPRIFSNIPEEYYKFLKIYEEPKKGHTYTIGVDSCKMTEENSGDALGMQVLDITAYPFKQVATFFAKEGFNYLFSPEMAFKLGMYYNEAYMFVENNEIGQEVANMIHFDYEYENIYFEKGNLPGYRTTKKTKRMGCTNLKMLLEKNQLVLNDFDTISQLSTFIKVKDSYKAESGYQDDLVMALISALFFLMSKTLDISEIADPQKLISVIKAEKDQEMEETPAFGYLPDDEFDNEIKTDADGFTW